MPTKKTSKTSRNPQTATFATALKPRSKNTVQNLPSADPRKEFLVGGILSNILGLRSNLYGSSNTLSASNDDLMKDYGYQIYDQMAKDPKVYKCLKIIKVNTLGDGVEFLPCLSDNDPNYEIAEKISEFCSFAVKGLKKPLKETLAQMLDAVKYGHKIAEITYKTEFVEEFGGTYLTLDSIKPKPIGLARFVVDDAFNILGIVGSNNLVEKTSSYNVDATAIEKSENIYSRNGKTYIKTVDGVENVFLSTDKFMYLTIDPEDEDPRGRSMLRSAFTFWNLKQNIIPEILRFILTCSIPLLIGFTPQDVEGQQAPILKDADGNIVKDALGRPILVNREEALREALIQARNATALALKGGSDVKEIGGKGSGLPFYKTLEMADSQIEASILLQTLATSEGRYSSRAQSQTHMDTLENLIWDIKKTVADMLVHQLLTPLIKYNFGKQYLKYMPVVSLGDTERRNFSLDGATVATLYAAGYLSEDQKRYTDQMLGLPVRNSNYDQFRNITPDEALRYSTAVLEQSQKESEIKKTREAANLERVNQVVGLMQLLQPKSVGKDGVSAGSGVGSDIETAINSFVKIVLEDIEKDKLTEDETRIFETLLGIGSRAEKVITPQRKQLGNLDNLDANKLVDTGIQPTKPVSGDGNTVPQPYISSKGKGKPATFSFNNRFKNKKR